MFGYSKPLFGYSEPLFGYSKPLFGYSKPLATVNLCLAIVNLCLATVNLCLALCLATVNLCLATINHCLAVAGEALSLATHSNWVTCHHNSYWAAYIIWWQLLDSLHNMMTVIGQHTCDDSYWTQGFVKLDWNKTSWRGFLIVTQEQISLLKILGQSVEAHQHIMVRRYQLKRGQIFAQHFGVSF